MKTMEDIFSDSFYGWWRNQTTPQKMTLEMAIKLLADCRFDLEQKGIPDQMAQDEFEKHIATAHKVILFGVSWNEAKTKSVDDLQKAHPIPKK